VLYWSSGDGGRSRLLAARARGRNRFSGGGRGTTKDEAAEEDEEQAADVVIVDAGDDEEYTSDEVSGFRGLVLNLSYRCDHNHTHVWVHVLETCGSHILQFQHTMKLEKGLNHLFR